MRRFFLGCVFAFASYGAYAQTPQQFPVPASGGGGAVTSVDGNTGAVVLGSSDITTALGFTPYNATNPSGYITSGSVSGTYAPLASPTFTGTVTIPSGASISGFLTSATAASTYAPLASPTFTGTVTIPSGASISGFAPLASPALTGTPTGVTQASTDTSIDLATDAFVAAVLASPPAIGATTASTGKFTTLTTTGNIVTGGALTHTGLQHVTPANNGTGTVNANTDTVYVDPAGTIATYTLTMPSAPTNGQDVTILCGQTVTSLILTPNTSQWFRPNTSGSATVTVTCGPTQTGGVRLRYYTAGTAWFFY